MARTPPHRSKMKPLPPAPAERDENGRLAKGNTCNPGGLTKSHREMRSAFLKRFPVVLELTDKWLSPDWPDPEDRREAYRTTVVYSLGKPVKASEMPALVEPKPLAEGMSDTAGLLVELRGLLASGISTLKAQQEAGDLTPDMLGVLGKVGQDLGNLLKTEAEAARASQLGSMSVEQLLEIVCSHFPPEQVGQALKRRLEAQEGKA